MVSVGRLFGRFEFGQMLGGADEAVPVFVDVFGGAADLGDILGDFDGGDHFDGIPRADGEFVGVGLFARNVNADFATHATLQVNFAPRLHAFDATI